MGQALETVKRFYKHFGEGDFGGLNACFGADCRTVTPAGTMNVKEHEEFARAFKSALADARMEIVRTVEAGVELFVAGRFKGKHTVDLLTPQGTIPAVGAQLDLPYADYFKVENGKIVVHEVFYDQAAMMAQLTHKGA